jgi:hypothetical protein
MCVCVGLMHIHAGRRSGERRSGYTMSPNVRGSNTTLLAGPHRFSSPLCLFAFCGVCAVRLVGSLRLELFTSERQPPAVLPWWLRLQLSWEDIWFHPKKSFVNKILILKTFKFEGEKWFSQSTLRENHLKFPPTTPPTATFNSVLYILLYKEKQVLHYTGVLGRLIDFDRTDAILIRFFHPR